MTPHVFRFEELPKETLWDGSLTRTALRSDGALVTLNWIQPTAVRVPPHHHPFDQLSFVLQGRLMVELAGEAVELPPGSAIHIPRDVPHTVWPLGPDVVLNLDVFAPPRADYFFLARHQLDRAKEVSP